MLQAHLGPLLQGVRKLQYDSKTVSSELDPATTAAAFMNGSGLRRQQLQEKAQALQQCIDSKLQHVSQDTSRNPKP